MCNLLMLMATFVNGKHYRWLAAGLLITLLPAAIVHHYFYAEHVVFSKVDPRSQLELTAFCKWADASYQVYIKISSPTGRLLSLNAIPSSLDVLSDCTERQYTHVVALEPNANYTVLFVHFENKNRPPVEVPLLLRGLGLSEEFLPDRRIAH